MMKLKFPSHLGPQPDYLLEAKYSISPTLPRSIDAFAGKAVKLNSPVLV